MYNFEEIPTPELRKKFIELGEQWWWESNRKIPINIFLKNEFTVFKPCLRTFIAKDCDVLSGPQVSLKDIMEKRVKKRSIQLVKKTS
jgi:hypothetical protein